MARKKTHFTTSERIGQVVSRFFEPIVEIPILLVAATTTAYLNGYRWRFLALLMFLDAIVPGLYFLYLVFIKKTADFDMSDRRTRRPLYRLAVATHLAGVLMAFLIDREPLAQILLSFWLIALLFMFITEHWKISLHAGVNSMLATFGILVLGWHQVWWLVFLPLIVSIARVMYHRHTVAQVVAGSFVPAFLLPLMFWVFGV